MVRMLVWPTGAPGAVGDEDQDRPTLTAYLPSPEIATGASVLVCPGGGYGFVCDTYEGHDVAEWFRGMGVAAFVLRYRIAPRYHHPAPLMDARQAMRTIRARSGEWGLDPSRVGVMGFSAGGHLASCVGTMFGEDDQAGGLSSRPDFMVLVYPVITLLPPHAHAGSRANLLGENPDQRLVEDMSTQNRVTSATPPTFLVHSDADDGVAAENSVMFYTALRKAGVPAEMHIYANGPHGFGLGADYPFLDNWPERLKNWMKWLGLLERTTE